MKMIRSLFICFCLIGIWNACPHFNITSSPVSSIEKISPSKTKPTTFQAFEKIEWEEDFNDEVAQKLTGAYPTIIYFFKTVLIKTNLKSQHFYWIRSFFPPLYLRHCTFRI
jgi:hypothetical protein